jgi:hypothetical protein
VRGDRSEEDVEDFSNYRPNERRNRDYDEIAAHNG